MSLKLKYAASPPSRTRMTPTTMPVQRRNFFIELEMGLNGD
jgi:hypothetical protein